MPLKRIFSVVSIVLNVIIIIVVKGIKFILLTEHVNDYLKDDYISTVVWQ